MKSFEDWVLNALSIFRNASKTKFEDFEDMVRDYLNEFAVPILLAKNLPEEKRSIFLRMMRREVEAGRSARNFEGRYPPSIYEYDTNSPVVQKLNELAERERNAILGGDFDVATSVAQQTLDYINELTGVPTIS